MQHPDDSASDDRSGKPDRSDLPAPRAGQALVPLGNAITGTGGTDPRLARYVHARAPQRYDLAAIDPGEHPFSRQAAARGASAREAAKAQDKAEVEALAGELAALQERFHADGRRALLVIVQGMDASGKDGTLRAVFSRMNALGVHATSWKAPTVTERAHDFLWRIHARLPARGEIALHNRSHYEDVLVPVVGGTLKGEALAARYRAINDFERLLVDEGTLVLKFMLHLSKDEQRERLQARVDDPAKRWKFDLADLAVRERWADYQQAYADAISATGTSWAPWIVVPADSKTHRNLMVAKVVAGVMGGLDLRPPPGQDGVAGLVVV